MAFTRQTDIEYWYEPCRGAVPTRHEERGTGHQPHPPPVGAACALRVASTLLCTLSFDDFDQMLGDQGAMLNGRHDWWERTPHNGHDKAWSFRQYDLAMRACWARHSAAKVIRLKSVSSLLEVTSSSRERSRLRTLVLVRHPADMAASRLELSDFSDVNGMNPGFNNELGGSIGVVSSMCAQAQALLVHNESDLTFRMEDFFSDPRWMLQRIYEAVGLPSASVRASEAIQKAHKALCDDPGWKPTATESRFKPRFDVACSRPEGRRLAIRADDRVGLQLRQRGGKLWEHVRRECSVLLSLHYPTDVAAPSTVAAGPQENPPRLSYKLLESLVPVPQHRLLMCLVEKNGVTALGVLAADLLGLHQRVDRAMADGFIAGQDGFPYKNTFHEQYATMRKSPLAHKATAAARLFSPFWRKVVVVRHPVERFVSAYQSKCVAELAMLKAGGYYAETRCLDVFRLRFEDVSMRAVAERLHLGAADPHWAPQSAFCGGLGETSHHYERVMHGDMAEALPRLLLRWGLPAAVVARASRVLQTTYKPARFGTKFHHQPNTSLRSLKTDNTSSGTMLEAATRRLVEWFYRDDFALVGLPRPHRTPSNSSLETNHSLAGLRGRGLGGGIV